MCQNQWRWAGSADVENRGRPARSFVIAVCVAAFFLAATAGPAQPARALRGHVPEAVARLRPLADLAATTDSDNLGPDSQRFYRIIQQ
jgi:hypothetical protein